MITDFIDNIREKRLKIAIAALNGRATTIRSPHKDLSTVPDREVVELFSIDRLRSRCLKSLDKIQKRREQKLTK